MSIFRVHLIFTCIIVLPLMLSGQLNKCYTSNNEVAIFRGICYFDDYLYVNSYAKDTLGNHGHAIFKYNLKGEKLDSIMLIDSTKRLLQYQNTVGFEVSKQGTVYLWGTSGSNETFLAIIDEDLKEAKIKFYQFSTATYSRALNTKLLITDNSLYLIGRITLFDTFYTGDGFIIRTDVAGKEIWRRRFGEAGKEEVSESITKISDNEIVIGGRWAEPFQDHTINACDRINQAFLLAYDSLGNQLWQWQESSDYDNVYAKALVYHDNYFYYSSGKKDCFPGHPTYPVGNNMIVKQDARTMEKVFMKESPNKQTDFGPFWDFEMTPDSTALVACGRVNWVKGEQHKSNHYKISTSGEQIWYREDSTQYADSLGYEVDLYDIVMLPDSSTVSCGYSLIETADRLMTFGWLIRITADGCVDTLDCTPVTTIAPAARALPLSIYPNPATTTITLTAPPLSGHYTTQIIDLQGRLHHHQALSTYDTTMIDVQHLPQGLYIVQVLDKQGQVVGRGKFVKR